MLRAIIEKEIREILGSVKFAVTFGACALLILLSFYIGAANHRVNLEQYEAAKAENLRQMEGMTSWFSLEQFRIFLPPQPLASLATGASNDIGRTIEIHRQSELSADDSKYNEDPIYAVFCFLDLTFIFQIVLSLFAILLGYDAICGEKEQGTLRLTFANSVPRATYLMGKLIGSMITLVAALLIPILLGCLLLPTMGVTLIAEEWIRLAAIVLTGLLYFAVFLTMSIFVSTITHRTSNAFLAMLVIWVISVLIVPRSAVLLAGRAVDVPSVDELAAQKNSYSRELYREFSEGMSKFKAPPSEDPQETMTLFNQYIDSLSQDREQKMAILTNRLNEDRHNRQLIQQRLALNLARVSPAASLTLATTALAGTSIDLKNRFHETAMEFRNDFLAFMKEKTGMNFGGGMRIIMDDGQEDQQPIDPTEMPSYIFEPESLRASLSSALVDMGILGLFNLVFFIGAFVSFTRYDVR